MIRPVVLSALAALVFAGCSSSPGDSAKTKSRPAAPSAPRYSPVPEGREEKASVVLFWDEDDDNSATAVRLEKPAGRAPMSAGAALDYLGDAGTPRDGVVVMYSKSMRFSGAAPRRAKVLGPWLRAHGYRRISIGQATGYAGSTVYFEVWP